MNAKLSAESAAMKRSFVRNINHELRTPLAAIYSGLMLLNDDESHLSSAASHTLSVMHTACASAVDILDDLLIYDQIDGNDIKSTKTTCSLIDIVRSSSESFQIQAVESDILLSLSIQTENNIIVDGDETKLKRLFRKMIANGLKFTHPGEMVEIIIKRQAGCARIEVRDSGFGERVLDAFNSDAPYNPNILEGAQGSGLGMFLCHHIARLHGGEIGRCSAESGQGSIFYADLPLSADDVINAQDQVHTCITPSQSNKPTIKLLVVDDVALCRKMHCQLLKPRVQYIFEAVHGEDAVQQVQMSMQINNPFDAILMDNSMPIMNGTTASQAIRNLGYKGKIYGVTGNAFQKDIDDFLAHGADEVFIKPLSGEHLS